MAKNIREISLADIVPSSILNDPQVQASIKTLDPELQKVTHDIREALILSRIDELPEDVLDLLAWQYHVDFYEPVGMNIETKRKIVRSAIIVHRKKGTPWAVRRLLTDLGFQVEYTEWWQFGGEPCVDRLKIFASDDFDLSPESRAMAMRAWESVKAERTHLETLHVGLWHIDDFGQINDTFAVSVVTSHVEAYPWRGLHYGRFSYGDLNRYGNFLYGDGEYGGLMSGTRRYGDETPDILGALHATLAGIEDEYRIPSVYGALKFGNFHYGHDRGPQDAGGGVTYTRRRVYGRFSYGEGAAYYGSSVYGDFIYGNTVRYGEERFTEVI